MAGESAAGTARKKVALLIGSPVFGLTGPKTDVETMSRVLKNHGFETIETVGTDATRAKILSRWNDIVENVSSDDAVVIYYSGHGGQIKSTKSHREYKFIVPFDFADSTSEDFRGILDIEIMDLVGKTTEKTKNVTQIFDCCYSSQTSWDPWHGGNAARKSLHGFKTYDLSKQEDGLRDILPDQGPAFAESNPCAVKIFAGGAAEAAWEYTGDENARVGAFTRAFAIALNQGIRDGITWRALLARICELLAYEFPGQRPWAKGPSDRVLFETHTQKVDWLPITVLANAAIFPVGQASGLKEGSLYTVMPAEFDEPNDLEKLGDAIVTKVKDQVSEVDYFRRPESPASGIRITERGFDLRGILNKPQKAFIKEESALYKWPVSIPKTNSDPDLEERIKRSEYLRVREEQTDSDHLVGFCQHHNTIFGFTRKDTMCISSQGVEEAVLKAEQLAKAQHLLTLTGGSGEAFLQHDLDIQFRIASSENIFLKDGSDSAREGQHALIALANKGTDAVYVSVFDVNVWGRINHVSHVFPLGIHLSPNSTFTLGQDFGFLSESGEGIGLQWPEGFPRDGPIPETFIFIVTKEKVNLRGFARPREEVTGRPSRDTTSELEELSHRLSFSSHLGLPRNHEARVVPYDVQQIPWTLHPEAKTALAERTSSSAVTINGNLVNVGHNFPGSPFSDAESEERSDYILVHAIETLRRKQLVELHGIGATLQERIDNRLYLFHYGPTDLQPIREMAYVVDAAVYPTRVKVDLQLQKVARGDPDSTSSIIVAFHKTKSHNIDTIFASLGMIVPLAEQNPILDRDKIQVSVQASTVFDLATVDGVRTIQEVQEMRCLNNLARHTMNANIALNNTSYNGQGQTVAVADTGLDGDHPAFQGRITQLISREPSGSTADQHEAGHGTHVCGSVLGDVVPWAIDSTLQGIAPRASLVLQALMDNQGTMHLGSLTTLFLDPYRDHEARIHNNSWSPIWSGKRLEYGTYSEDVDDVVLNQTGLLICFAAGNDGDKQPGPTLGSVAAAKNCLTVGAIESVKDQSHSKAPSRLDGIWSISSQGPTAEGRIKPDVVAPGTSIFSERSSAVHPTISARCRQSADGYFMHLSGTSMATALVSGCAAILREVLVSIDVENPSAALMKALLINGADNFNQADYRTEGFGCINLKNSIDHVQIPEGDTAGFLDGQPLEEDAYHTVTVRSEGQGITLKVTMAYSDVPDKTLWNNLNLIVKASDGQERHGNMGTDVGFDQYNNVEQVVWKGIPPGQVDIIVHVDRISDPDEPGTQSFALAWRAFR